MKLNKLTAPLLGALLLIGPAVLLSGCGDKTEASIPVAGAPKNEKEQFLEDQKNGKAGADMGKDKDLGSVGDTTK